MSQSATPEVTENPPSSRIRWTSAGRRRNGAWVFSEEKVAGSRNTSRMSS